MDGIKVETSFELETFAGGGICPVSVTGNGYNRYTYYSSI